MAGHWCNGMGWDGSKLVQQDGMDSQYNNVVTMAGATRRIDSWYTTIWDGCCNNVWCNETDRQLGIQQNGTAVATMAGATRRIDS